MTVKRFRFSRTDIIIMLLALVYIVSPIDAIPELVAGPIGLTDDAAAVAILAATLMRSRVRKGKPDGPEFETSGGDGAPTSTQP